MWLKINVDWKAMLIEKQFRCFKMLIEFNADNKQCWLKNSWFCWLKLMLSENNRDAKECWLILIEMLDFVDGVHTVRICHHWIKLLFITFLGQSRLTRKSRKSSKSFQPSSGSGQSFGSSGRIGICSQQIGDLGSGQCSGQTFG